MRDFNIASLLYNNEPYTFTYYKSDLHGLAHTSPCSFIEEMRNATIQQYINYIHSFNVPVTRMSIWKDYHDDALLDIRFRCPDLQGRVAKTIERVLINQGYTVRTILHASQLAVSVPLSKLAALQSSLSHLKLRVENWT